jgi:hypothetical protein
MRAREMGISDSDIDLINLWRKVERVEGMKSNMPVWDHYT